MNDKFNYEVSHIVVTPRLIELLKQKPKGRYTRLEAYFDLLSMAMVKKPFSVFPKKPSAEMLGQFDTTVTELAARWVWQRATVRDFLAELTSIGQVSREDSYKNMTITFDALKFQWLQNLVEESEDAMHKSTAPSDEIDKDNSSGKTDKNFVQDFSGNNHVDVSANKEPPLMIDSAVTELERKQRKVCRQLYDEIFADMSDIIKEWAYTPKVEHALYRAFYNVCGADRKLWQEYLSHIKTDDTLTLAIYGNEMMISSAGKVEAYFIRFGSEFLQTKEVEEKLD